MIRDYIKSIKEIKNSKYYKSKSCSDHDIKCLNELLVTTLECMIACYIKKDLDIKSLIVKSNKILPDYINKNTSVSHKPNLSTDTTRDIIRFYKSKVSKKYRTKIDNLLRSDNISIITKSLQFVVHCYMQSKHSKFKWFLATNKTVEKFIRYYVGKHTIYKFMTKKGIGNTELHEMLYFGDSEDSSESEEEE